MSDFAQISLHVFERNREDGSQRRYEMRLLERDSAGASLPFDIEGGVTVEHGSNSHVLTDTLKPTKVQFRIKTTTNLAEKLRTAESRQYRLDIREVEANEIVFEGYVKPDFPRYDIFKKAETVEVTATGELGSLDAYNATGTLKTLYTAIHQINTEVELERQTDFYMRTRYTGQSLSDPIPQRIWLSELGKLGEDEGSRDNAVRQIAQEFNFQIFQHKGRLVVADAFERIRNATAVNRYQAGTSHGTENLLITLDKDNVVRKVADADRGPTGKRAERVGRVVQQRRLPEREESSFTPPQMPTPLNLIELEYDGVAVGGDIVRLNGISGTVEIAPPFQPEPHINTLQVRFDMLQFAFESDITGQTIYYDFISREWADQEAWGSNILQFFSKQSWEPGESRYPQILWFFQGFDLPEIPEGEMGRLTIRLRKEFEITSPPGTTMNSGFMDMRLTDFSVDVTFNDRPDDLFKQVIATNPTGITQVYPMFESDFDAYSGLKGTMFTGPDLMNLEMAASQWIDEETQELISFLALSARRKAHLMLGAADRVHVIVRDTTPVSLLNVIDFEGKRYLPVCIRHHLFTGYQEIWMRPAPGLEADFLSRYTYNPEELPGPAGRGTSRGWVTNQIINSMNSPLAAGAIARTVQPVGAGLVQNILIDRENILAEGDRIMIVDRFTLNRFNFTVTGQIGQNVTVEPQSIASPIPTGGYVFADQEALATGVLQSKFAFQIFARMNGVGVLVEDVDGLVTSLPVNLYTQVREGQIFGIPVIEREDPWYVQVAREASYVEEAKQLFNSGLQQLPVKPVTLTAPAESPLIISGIQLQSYFHVDPGGLYGKVTREMKAEALGTLAEDRSGQITSVALKEIPADTELAAGQELRIINREGRNERLITDGAQSLQAGTGTVNVEQVTLVQEYLADHSYVREPSYTLTGRLSITSGLTLLNQQAITDNNTAIAGLVLNVQDLESASATLFASVQSNTGDIGTLFGNVTTLTNAQVQLQADLNSAQASITASIDRIENIEDDGRAIIRSNSAPSQRPSGEPLQNGDIWIRGNLNNDARVRVGSSWVPFDGEVKSTVAGLVTQVGDFDPEDLEALQDAFGDLVDDIQAQAVLFVNDQGNIASINLVTGSTGSAIDISADQVKINGVIFEDSNGIIRSSNFSSGVAGWRIRGNGNAEFNNITVRGTLSVVELEVEMEVQGAIYLPDKSAPDIKISADNGIRIRGSTTSVESRRINFTDPDNFDDIIAGIDHSNNELFLFSDLALSLSVGNLFNGAFVRLLPSNLNISTSGTRDLVLSTGGGSGELQIIVNPTEGMNISGLPTSNPGGSNNIWRDGTTLRIT